MAPPVAKKPVSQTADVVTLPDGTTVRAEERGVAKREKEQRERATEAIWSEFLFRRRLRN